MSNSAPHEGRDHAILLPSAGAVAAVLALVAIVEFPAQQPAAQSAPCTTIADDAERLACYDRALRAASPQHAPPPSQTPAAAPVQAPSAPAEAAQAPAPASVQSAPQSSVSPPASSPAPQATASAQPQRDADREPIAIVIVGVRTTPGRETSFTAQDGTTWVQTDSQRIVGLPDTPFDAELKFGAMGSRFLVPKSGVRAIRVRPVER
jgi:uncharacterized protein involved in copper resistance